MIIFRNFDFANEYFDFESKYIFVNNNALKHRGWYKFIYGVFSALFVLNNKLYFILGDNEYFIDINCSVYIEIFDFNKKIFNLLRDTDIILKFTYEIDASYSNISPFEYLDDEDFDWGGFLSQIINDKEKKVEFIKSITVENDTSTI